MSTAEQLRDTAKKAESRAAARDLVIPEIRDPARRAACEADDCLWLQTYCSDVFYNPFTPHQIKIIADCGEALRYGTQKCKAAPRGDGKTSIVKYLALKYALCRQVRFPLIISATGSKSKKTLNSLKHRLASRADSVLAEDYPLESYVARYVDPWPSRARNVTANGRRSIHVEWGAEMVILPTWEDQEPLGPIILALGITSDELQGCNVYDQRPDFVMLDDLDSRDSLASEDGVIAGKIEDAIDKTIAGLGGQSRRLGQFMLCTITSRQAAAYKYSDPVQKPSWSGERISAIVEWPERVDLWQTYMEMRQWGKGTRDTTGMPVDVFGRSAHQHYLDNRAEMDRGAVLANPYNYERNILPDGTPTHVSALQRCYDYIADYGMESFLTEHQNDPPEDDSIVDSGITSQLIQRQVSGFGKGVIPPGCILLTHGCDVGKTKGFHWVVRAWRPDGTRFTIDYGNMDVIGAKYGSDEGLERALYNAVLRRMDEFRAAMRGDGDTPYITGDGELLNESLSLFDARWKTDTIIKAVLACGLRVNAILGIGQSAGCVSGRFRDITQSSNTRRLCGTTGAYEELHAGDYGKCWAVHADADRWKEFEHDGWMTATDKPGCSFLFGEASERKETLSADQRAHEIYAQHVCGEVLAEVEQKGFRVRKWIPKGKQNDYLDASYITCVAAAIKGIRVVAGRAEVKQPKTLAEMAKAAGRKS